MYDPVVGKLTKSNGTECPYQDGCEYGKKLSGSYCPYYWRNPVLPKSPPKTEGEQNDL